ncbi:MAG: hypothetical protein HZA83_03200, partial [Thaumarchaeota archaeon]|nr:hypothetical protein [Nitrososphaerota archaeon]
MHKQSIKLRIPRSFRSLDGVDPIEPILRRASFRLRDLGGASTSRFGTQSKGSQFPITIVYPKTEQLESGSVPARTVQDSTYSIGLGIFGPSTDLHATLGQMETNLAAMLNITSFRNDHEHWLPTGISIARAEFAFATEPQQILADLTLTNLERSGWWVFSQVSGTFTLFLSLPPKSGTSL